MATTLVFEWDPPQGSGPAAIIDYYVISILPRTLSPLNENVVQTLQTPPWNVTLSHNTAYSINISAVNCAGVSSAFIFKETEYSKGEVHHNPN